MKVKLKVLVTQSCLTLCDPMDYSPPDSSVHCNSPGKNTGVSYHFPFQGIFPTQGWTQISHIAGRLFTNWAIKEDYAKYVRWNSRLDEAQPGNLASRLPGEISITSDTQMTPPLWHKVNKN